LPFFLNNHAYKLLPAFLAIGLAFWTKNVLFSLFVGIFAGAWLVLGQWSLQTGFISLLKVPDTYLLQAMSDSSHAGILLFTLMVGGLIALLTQSGGLFRLLGLIKGYARNATRTQGLVMATGMLIFIDDYANTIIAGNLFRGIADRYRISREKLSFIIDATSAPVASLSVISTWIAYELGLLATALNNAGLENNAYAVFIQSLPYRFYAILLLVFIVGIIVMGRDWGPMWRAERRARSTGQVTDPASTPMLSKEIQGWEDKILETGRWYHGLLPLLVLVFTVLFGFYWDGKQSLIMSERYTQATGWLDVFGAADPIKVLIWAALLSTLCAFLMMVVQKIFDFTQAIEVWMDGLKSMVFPAVVLIFAWGLSAVLNELEAGKVLSGLLQGWIEYPWMPTMTFALGFLIAFSTGTSWGTMAILFPLCVPAVHDLYLASGQPMAQFEPILYSTVGAVLTGAIFGDHVSPISDTTIMSSMWSGVDHMDHVQTQMPYALTVGAVAIGLGYLPSGYGISPWLLLLLGSVTLLMIIRFVGKKVEEV
jgi:Na+/H+ antiporter NhaC